MEILRNSDFSDEVIKDILIESLTDFELVITLSNRFSWSIHKLRGRINDGVDVEESRKELERYMFVIDAIKQLKDSLGYISQNIK